MSGARTPAILLLDANVVIHLFRCGIWARFVRQCEVHLAQTVVEEADYFEDEDDNRITIDLTDDVATGDVTVFEIAGPDLQTFRDRYDPSYAERLDPGETESLAYLLRNVGSGFRICSSDSIVFRILGNLSMSDAGVSLEEALKEVGLGRPLPYQFTGAFRKRWSARGFQNGLGGIGSTE